MEKEVQSVIGSFLRFKRNRKGITSTIFNWIFVLIVGGILFIFFMNIAMRQKTISEEKTARTLLRDLKSIIIGSKVSTSSTNVLQLPKKKIEYDCQALHIGGVARPVSKWPIFSPGEIEGRELIVWSEDWSVGYRIANFLYMSYPEVRYVFVADNPGTDPTDKFIKDLYTTMPEVFTKELLTSAQFQSIPDKNDKKVRFITGLDITSVPPALQKKKDGDVTGIKIVPHNPSMYRYHTATISFINKKGTSFIPFPGPVPDSYYTLENASLYGAIFADDARQYECVMKNAFEEFGIITSVYGYRTD
ncbi:hypothetical protein COY95_05030, partial [Candidatus Woesearchaeota archaeon CG_4_10_14_0_8_um_filter_47_5]